MAKKNERASQANLTDKDNLHRKWHLGGNEHSVVTTEFEWAAMRFYNAFERYCLQIGGISGSTDLTFHELILLHIVYMQHHPQTASSLARQLNRDDIPNIQYILRKLADAGLVVKNKENRGKTYTFSVTETGEEKLKKYAEIRSKLLVEQTKYIDNIDEKLKDFSHLLGILAGIYDEAGRISSTYSPAPSDNKG